MCVCTVSAGEWWRREINAAVVLCGALRHFDKSHRELTTPADSTLSSDWLEQLQVRRMLMDVMWTTNHTRKRRRTQGRTPQIGQALDKSSVLYMNTHTTLTVYIITRAN